mgnify:CR=1 FL=1
MTRNRIIIIAVIILLALLGLILLALTRTSEENLLQENPNLPKSEWSRIVQIEEDDLDNKVISNKIDGYEISVPDNWQVEETASAKGGLKVFYNPKGDYNFTEFSEGIMLNVLTVVSIEEAKNYVPSTARFLDQQTEIGLAYRASYKATQDTTAGETPIENSLVVKYIFPSDERVYLVSCLTLGNNFSELALLCEKQVLTFKILR